KQEYLAKPPFVRQQEKLSLDTLSTVIYIPVVVHIVLPHALRISNQDVELQINLLNTYFAGLNGDSTLIPPAFKPLFGKSKIQFKLAKRTPSGELTNGIERRNSNAVSSFYLDEDPIKYTWLGGLDAWDYTRYVNIWVGADEGDGSLLGYATFPGADYYPESQGIFVNYLCWGNNPCYVVNPWVLGKISVHEMGHYFGLYHIWGDDGGACDGDDFRQLPSTCTLPAAMLIGDTPNQQDATAYCPSGVRVDGCSLVSPGILYQN